MGIAKVAGKVTLLLFSLMLSFFLGYSYRSYRMTINGDTFRHGYETRDLEAYTNYHIRHGMIVVSSYSRTDYGMQSDTGGTTMKIIFCEPRDLKVGTFVSFGFYDHGGCMSLDGPKAWIAVSDRIN